jgi:hypothetical protein
VNGRAVSIEMFLDFNYKRKGDVSVRWLTYDSTMGAYQGAIDEKDQLVRKFKSARLGIDHYDTSKLEALAKFIYSKCVGIYGS